jgi:hypothetical protein
MENINCVDVMYIVGKELVQLVEYSFCRYDGRYRTAATKSQGVSLQVATALAYTPVEKQNLNKEMATLY